MPFPLTMSLTFPFRDREARIPPPTKASAATSKVELFSCHFSVGALKYPYISSNGSATDSPSSQVGDLIPPEFTPLQLHVLSYASSETKYPMPL
jgi:hypothetical protein